MDDSLEKFLLEYQVEVKEAISRLESLNEKIGQTDQKSAKAKKSLKDMASEGLDEVKKLSPELEGAISGAQRLTSTLGSVGVALGGIAVAVAAIVIGVKGITEARKEYEAQRMLGYRAGMTPIQVEAFQRQAVAASGKMDAQGARAIIDKTQGLAMSAFTDPDAGNVDQYKLQMLGSSSFDQDGKLRDTMTILDDISRKFQSMTKEQAQALGQSIGYTHDEIDALRNRSAALIESTKLTDTQTQDILAAQKSMDKLNKSFSQITEGSRVALTVIGSRLMPMFEDIIENVISLVGDAPQKINNFFDQIQAAWNATLGREDESVIETLLTKGNVFSALDFFLNPQNVAKRFEEEKKAIQDEREKRKKEADSQNQNARQLQAQFSRDINLFANAVSQFANIDEQRAMAMWAGEAGQAAGLGTSLTRRTYHVEEGAQQTNSSHQNASNWQQAIDNAADRFANRSGMGRDEFAATIAKLIHNQSGFDANKASKSGAVGAMQLMPSEVQRLGVSDPFNIGQNVSAGAQKLVELIEQQGSLSAALSKYSSNLANDVPEYLTAKSTMQRGSISGSPKDAESGKVLKVIDELLRKGNDSATWTTHSGASEQVRGLARVPNFDVGVYDRLAESLGIPREQIVRGEFTKGDIKYAGNKMFNEALSDFRSTNMRATMDAGANERLQRQKLMAQHELPSKINHLEALRQILPKLESMAKRGDAQQITAGLPIPPIASQITFQITESKDARETARQVTTAMEGLQAEYKSAVAQSADGIKY